MIADLSINITRTPIGVEYGWSSLQEVKWDLVVRDLVNADMVLSVPQYYANLDLYSIRMFIDHNVDFIRLYLYDNPELAPEALAFLMKMQLTYFGF